MTVEIRYKGSKIVIMVLIDIDLDYNSDEKDHAPGGYISFFYLQPVP